MSDALRDEDLVGATLDQVMVDWRNGIVLVTFLPSPKMSEACTLRAEGLRALEMKRGASASRLVKSVTRGSNGSADVIVESGETVHLEAEFLTLVPTGG